MCLTLLYAAHIPPSRMESLASLLNIPEKVSAHGQKMVLLRNAK
ncbi:hypothetical protein [Cognaticolwellia beringensis]|nr:hypothetical protein [Cognaticolwellia beringensis]